MITKAGKIRKGAVPSSTGEKLFAKLAEYYGASNPHVERAMLFGFDCLRVDGKVFAKLHNDQLVMKLPAKRITALVDSGLAGSYKLRGHSTKEWGVIWSSENIVGLAEEARVFAENSKS